MARQNSCGVHSLVLLACTLLLVTTVCARRPLPFTLVTKFSASLAPQGFSYGSTGSRTRLVSSDGVRGSALITVSASGLGFTVSLTASGTYPRQETATQPFDPTVNTRMSVSLYRTTDNGSSFTSVLSIPGTWTAAAAGGAYKFDGSATVTDASNLKISASPQQFVVVLSIPPYPGLSDMVYISQGTLSPATDA